MTDTGEDWPDTKALTRLAAASGQAVGAVADGAARAAETRAAAVHGAASAMQAAPTVLREGGNLLSRLLRRGSATALPMSALPPVSAPPPAGAIPAAPASEAAEATLSGGRIYATHIRPS